MARNQIQFQKGLSEPEFNRLYGTEDACFQALEKLRWPEGFICPACGHENGHRLAYRSLMQCCSSQELSTTADTTGDEQFVTITHPFHPLFERRFVLISVRQAWGEYRVYFYDDDDNLMLLPAGWTDAQALDPFALESDGKSLFRADDLLALAELIKRASCADEANTK